MCKKYAKHARKQSQYARNFAIYAKICILALNMQKFQNQIDAKIL